MAIKIKKESKSKKDKDTILTFKLNFKIIRPLKPINKDFVELICTEDQHNKYYSLQLVPDIKSNTWSLKSTYGKIGTNYLYKTHTFLTRETASKALDKKVGEKLKKGYKIKSKT